MSSLLHPLRKAYRALLDLRDEAVLARLAQPRPVLRVREEFPQWLNLLNLRAKGVEIGVQRGTFSTVLLSRWAGQHLTCIDPWRSFDPASYHDTANVEQARQDANFETTRQRISPFGERASQLRKTSAEAAADFAEASLDFAYIDAQHHYEAVVEDIALWWPKVRPGGILAGHDYLDGIVRGTDFGVKRAVDEFAQAQGLPVIASLEMDYPSWFIVKA
jgi:hypothetical protein